MIVKTNLITPDQHSEIKSLMLDHIPSPFPWYLGIIDSRKTRSSDNMQFCHHFYSDYKPVSPYIDMLQPIIEKLKPKALIRIKANLTFRTDNKIKFPFHEDSKHEAKSAVYYVNTNNGETIFETGEKIKSEENSMVVFPSKIQHGGTSHTCSNPCRVVINFVYF